MARKMSLGRSSRDGKEIVSEEPEAARGGFHVLGGVAIRKGGGREAADARALGISSGTSSRHDIGRAAGDGRLAIRGIGVLLVGVVAHLSVAGGVRQFLYIAGQIRI